MAAIFGALVYISMWIAAGICWAIYYIGVALFYLIAALVEIIRDTMSERGKKQKQPTARQIARETSYVVEDMYRAAEAATERVRAFNGR